MRDKQIDYKKCAEAMRENCCKDSDGNIVCTSELWELIASTIESVAEYRRASEVAEEIFGEIEKQLARYSHLHRYAEEAREVTEEYADGTPCEMTSVWEVFSLRKNGWDDYETMNKLQDNIGNIEKSRLLKEFEGDIAELKKKYTESEKDDG